MEKAGRDELLPKAGALRNDLQTIQSELKVRCPTIAVLCLHESYSGFSEFTARMPDELRRNRSGFSVPLSKPFDTRVAKEGFQWLAHWFASWSLILMKKEYENKDGNAKLVLMNAQFRTDLAGVCRLIESSFAIHARAEPILVRGCYFAVCGPEFDNRAFVPGLIKGSGSKMIDDTRYTSWSRGADLIDRRYRLASLGIGLATAAIALPIWFTQIIQRPVPPGVGHPFWGWIGLMFLAAVWLVGLLAPQIRRLRAAQPSK